MLIYLICTLSGGPRERGVKSTRQVHGPTVRPLERARAALGVVRGPDGNRHDPRRSGAESVVIPAG
jgi:hypothetical protein